MSALSLSDLVSNPDPSVFQISNKPQASSPSDRAGGPSIEMMDLPFSLWPVIIRLILFSLLYLLTMF